MVLNRSVQRYIGKSPFGTHSSVVYFQTIRQRLLENKELDIHTAFTQTHSLDLAQRRSEIYAHQEALNYTATDLPTTNTSCDSILSVSISVGSRQRKCYFCGNSIHNRWVIRLGTASVALVVRRIISVNYVNPHILQPPRQLHHLLTASPHALSLIFNPSFAAVPHNESHITLAIINVLSSTT